MGREVSCSVFQIYFDEAQSRHIPDAELCRHTSFTPADLLDKRNRVDWEVYRAVTADLRNYLTDEDFERMGRRASGRKVWHPAITIARLLFTGAELYLWLNNPVKEPDDQLFTCVTSATRSVGRNRIIATVTLKPGYANCREFFLITKGAFESASTLLGLGPANVGMREFDGGAEYDILCPEGGGALSWLRRAAMWPFAARSAARELKAAYEALQGRFTRLEEAKALMQRQTVELKTAYVVSRLISSNLDLDATLEAIARSLVEVGHCAAATVTLEIANDGKSPARCITAGTVPPDGRQIVRSLETHGGRIGELRLCLRTDSGYGEADELLNYILPVIAMEIDDALAFKAVNDLRASLERTVAERTSELRKVNEQLRETQARRDRLFSDISHEFRTPLTLILGPLETAIEQTRDIEERKRLQMIRQNAMTVLDLINQLLDLSKLQAGKTKLAASEADIVPFLKGLAMLYEPLAERKAICLKVCPGKESINLYFDREKAETIFNNLLINAFKFTPDGGSVTVELRKTASSVRIMVKDTGSGIPAQHMPYIFDRFYQVDDSMTFGHSGTGIGLALAKELVELHHGTIRAESRPDNGSTFIVEFPLGRDHLKDEEIVRIEPRPPSPAPLPIDDNEIVRPALTTDPPTDNRRGSPVVLIVEDNADVLTYIRESFPATFTTITASDGREGFTRATEHIPDIVISDVRMPVMNGVELCHALKQDTRTSHVPIILLTARAGSEDRIRGLEAGADDYLTKPFSSRELLARVNNLIEERHQLRKKFSSGIVLKPGEVAVTSLDEALLKRIMSSIEMKLGDENLTVDDLARAACLSRAQLNRKLHALTNLSPGELIRYVRLERARELLEKSAGSVAEVAFQVGFGSPSYFSASFHERFGMPPSEVRPVR